MASRYGYLTADGVLPVSVHAGEHYLLSYTVSGKTVRWSISRIGRLTEDSSKSVVER